MHNTHTVKDINANVNVSHFSDESISVKSAEPCSLTFTLLH